jgi:hypothetical protein
METQEGISSAAIKSSAPAVTILVFPIVTLFLSIITFEMD